MTWQSLQKINGKEKKKKEKKKAEERRKEFNDVQYASISSADLIPECP